MKSYIPGMSAEALKRHPWVQPRFGFGMALGDWIRLLARHRFRVHWTQWPWILATAPVAAAHSALHRIQDARFGATLAATRIGAPPVFILGHWRSGTTFLHEMLACDPRFTCPNSLECFCPGHFLVTGSALTRWAPMPVGATRVLDATPMRWDSPQEEEFALMHLGIPSPYLVAAFPNEASRYDPWFALDEVSPPERRRWEDAYLRFLKSVVLHRPGRLVLKSPLHTFRVPLLRSLFPEARFVHVVRDPLDVFASSLHALDLVCRLNGLQIAASGVLEEYVLGRYERMQHAWKAARERLRPGQWMEIRFEELVRAPADALKRVYDEMDLGGWSNAAPSVRAFLAGREGYRQNRLVTSPEQRERVRVRWGEWVRGYGYEPVRRPSAATPAFCP